MVALSLGPLFLPSCASPERYEDRLGGSSQIQVANPRKLSLTFERESNYAALASQEVTVTVKSPATLVSPANGRARTDSTGTMEIVVMPVAIYDKNALKAGDIVVDFPAELTVSMAVGQAIYEWDIDGHESFARYSDPLYRGLNRDPDPEALSLTLTIP